MRLWLDRLASPLGDLLLVTDGEGTVRALDFHDHDTRMHRLLRAHYGAYDLRDRSAPNAVKVALASYFSGDLHTLLAVPVGTSGTEFQRLVWAKLRAIPPGATASYGQIASALDRPGASRAVGMANGANPIAIIVPCHRVIGTNAALTGFGGGLHRKRWLLDHEAVGEAPKLAFSVPDVRRGDAVST